MYVSPAVRSIRDRPIDGEPVTLLVRAADDVETVRERIETAGWTVDRRLAFETLAVSVPQTAVAELCALEGIESIETDRTLTIDPDGAGEDVSPPEGG